MHMLVALGTTRVQRMHSMEDIVLAIGPGCTEKDLRQRGFSDAEIQRDGPAVIERFARRYERRVA